MKFQQRRTVVAEEPSEAEPSELWQPALVSETDLEVPEEAPVWTDVAPTDSYVTIDEHVGTTIGVVAAPWPSLGPAGLRFGEPITAAWFDADALQAAIDAYRQAAGQVTRRLRIGDSFWLRGFDAESIERWQDLRDITFAARALAKLAVANVSVGDVSPEDLFDKPTTDQGPEQAPPTGAETAMPTV